MCFLMEQVEELGDLVADEGGAVGGAHLPALVARRGDGIDAADDAFADVGIGDEGLGDFDGLFEDEVAGLALDLVGIADHGVGDEELFHGTFQLSALGRQAARVRPSCDGTSGGEGVWYHGRRLLRPTLFVRRRAARARGAQP